MTPKKTPWSSLGSSFLLSIHGRVLRVVYDENLDGGFRRYEFEPKLFLNKREE